MPIPVVARYRAWVYGPSLARIVGSNPAEGMDVCLVRVLCVEIEASAKARSIGKRGSTECGLSAYDRGTSHKGT
jgi:hypothetical protein